MEIRLGLGLVDGTADGNKVGALVEGTVDGDEVGATVEGAADGDEIGVLVDVVKGMEFCLMGLLWKVKMKVKLMEKPLGM